MLVTFDLSCGHSARVIPSAGWDPWEWWCCGGYQQIIHRAWDDERGYEPLWPDATRAAAVLRTGKSVVTVQVRDGLL